jgi:hypothetical protein
VSALKEQAKLDWGLDNEAASNSSALAEHIFRLATHAPYAIAHARCWPEAVAL